VVFLFLIVPAIIYGVPASILKFLFFSFRQILHCGSCRLCTSVLRLGFEYISAQYRLNGYG